MMAVVVNVEEQLVQGDATIGEGVLDIALSVIRWHSNFGSLTSCVAGACAEYSSGLKQ